MKRLFIESRGAIHAIRAASALADRIHFDFFNDPSKCWIELKLRRAHVRNAHAAFRETEHLPCGYQDAAGDRLDHACRDFSDYLNAMIICRGRVPKSLQYAWNRWTGQD